MWLRVVYAAAGSQETSRCSLLGQLGDARSFVDPLAANPGFQHLHILEFVGGNAQNIAVDHDKVGEFSRRQRSFLVFFESCISAVTFLKLYEKIYAPLTAGILQPFAADQSIPKEKITALDRRYTAVIQALDDLVEAVDLKAA